MSVSAITAVFLACVCTFLYQYSGCRALLTLAITFATTSYHLLMRLSVGPAVDRLMQGKADYTRRRYHCSEFEIRLYEKLGVKRWKEKVPTWTPAAFDHSSHSWEEIAQATCISETVHEVNMILSFVPVCFSIWCGAAAVFLITSLLAALTDLVFVIVQRYNRPRLLRLIVRSTP